LGPSIVTALAPKPEVEILHSERYVVGIEQLYNTVYRDFTKILRFSRKIAKTIFF